MRRICTKALLVGLGLFAGCQALSDIPEGTCGNLVLETNLGEECDSDALVEMPAESKQLFSCIRTTDDDTAGTACHFRCRDGAIENGIDTRCPPGMFCGEDDQVCRKPKGSFEDPETLVNAGARRLRGVDFDNDTWTDLVAVGADAISVHYLSENGRLGSSYEIASPPTVPAVIQGVGDPPLPALVLDTGLGFAVLTGRDDRTLLPKVYKAFGVKGYQWGEAVDVLPGQAGDELFMYGKLPDDTYGFGLTSLESGGALFPLFHLASFDRVGPAAVAKLYTAEACESVVFAFTDRTEVNIYAPCNPLAEQPVIGLEGRKTWGGVIATTVEVPSDSIDPMGLVIGSRLSAGGDERIDLYRADPADIPPSPFVPTGTSFQKGDQNAACDTTTSPPVIAGFPLAVGDINGDGRADIIDPVGAIVSLNDGWLRLPCDTEREVYKAHIGRFNGDAFPDVVLVTRRWKEPGQGGPSEEVSVEFRIGAGGGLFNPFAFAMGDVTDIHVGDFDGDVIDDVIVRESDAGGMNARLIAFFGSIAGGPEAPAPIGILSNVREVVVGPTIEPDGLDDLIVVSSAPQATDWDVTLLPGNTGRRLLSPLLLLRKDKDSANNDVERLNRPAKFCAGRFGEKNGIFAVAEETIRGNAGTTSTTTKRLWLAHVDENADPVDTKQIDITASAVDLDDGLLLATVDIDADSGQPQDGVVGFVGGLGVPTSIVQGGYKGGTPVEPESVESLDLALQLTSEGMDAPMIVDDLDGDGWRDIALLVEDMDDPGVVILWNHGACSAGTDFCKENLSELRLSQVKLVSEPSMPNPEQPGPMEPPLRIIDIAFLRADGDALKDLAVLTDQGVYVLRMNGAVSPPALELVTTKPEPLDGTASLRGRSLAAFDADRDGLDDLLIGTDSEIVLVRGEWRLR